MRHDHVFELSILAPTDLSLRVAALGPVMVTHSSAAILDNCISAEHEDAMFLIVTRHAFASTALAHRWSSGAGAVVLAIALSPATPRAPRQARASSVIVGIPVLLLLACARRTVMTVMDRRAVPSIGPEAFTPIHTADFEKVVGRAGIEPATIRLKVECSTPELPAHSTGNPVRPPRLRRNIAASPFKSIE